MDIHAYAFGGLGLTLRVPFPLEESSVLAPFARETPLPGWTVDCRLEEDFAPLVPAASPAEEGTWRTVWRQGDREARTLRYQVDGAPQPCCLWRREGDHIEMLWKPEVRPYLSAWQVLKVLELHHLLLERGGAILHASYILCQGRAILFSGPSGVGKSTQAALWEKYRGAEVVNGDRALVRAGEDGAFRAHGICFSGTSGICKDRSAPLAAVVLLAQGPADKVRPAGGIEALRALLPLTSCRPESPGELEHATDILSRLANAVPVFRLECRPGPEAVETLERML